MKILSHLALVLVPLAFASMNRVALAAAQTDTHAWEGWLDQKLLPEQEARLMMRDFLEQRLKPLPLPASQEEWLARRDQLRREIQTVLGIDDLVPPRWDLATQSKGTLQRDGYR